jgi:hypothetical protein
VKFEDSLKFSGAVSEKAFVFGGRHHETSQFRFGKEPSKEEGLL